MIASGDKVRVGEFFHARGVVRDGFRMTLPNDLDQMKNQSGRSYGVSPGSILHVSGFEDDHAIVILVDRPGRNVRATHAPLRSKFLVPLEKLERWHETAPWWFR